MATLKAIFVKITKLSASITTQTAPFSSCPDFTIINNVATHRRIFSIKCYFQKSIVLMSKSREIRKSAFPKVMTKFIGLFLLLGTAGLTCLQALF